MENDSATLHRLITSEVLKKWIFYPFFLTFALLYITKYQVVIIWYLKGTLVSILDILFVMMWPKFNDKLTWGYSWNNRSSA
jgi:hypothetical protein